MLSQSPLWVWVFTGVVVLVVVALLGVFAWEFLRARPVRRIRLGDTQVSLWVRQRRMPRAAAAIVAPVAPDLKMVAGIAKWIRDSTADAAQREADALAPLVPGQAAIVAGAKYRFRCTALAVVMDEHKRATEDYLRAAVADAIAKARREAGDSILIPDFTEDLLSQPRWISDEQRRATCMAVAEAVLQAVRASSALAADVMIWVWRPGVEDIWAAELDRLEQQCERPSAARPVHA